MTATAKRNPDGLPIAVLVAGSWGTALGILIARNGFKSVYSPAAPSNNGGGSVLESRQLVRGRGALAAGNQKQITSGYKAVSNRVIDLPEHGHSIREPFLEIKEVAKSIRRLRLSIPANSRNGTRA